MGAARSETGYTGVSDTPGIVRVWLLFLAALVFAMIVVGGATRLTDSGLSITEWQPIVGILPPLNDADWQEAFAKYQQTPEYHQVNRGMSLEAFKFIFWWEWAHRFLGRLIGFAFAVPFVLLVVTHRLPHRLIPRLLGVFALGGLQGAIGWYMVKSGLVDRVDVSQYRLALHLSVAVAIFGLLLWMALDLGPSRAHILRSPLSPAQRRAAVALTGLVFLQIVLGGLVAGLRAGLSHNTWPLMDGQLIPDGLGAMSPWYLNFFENALTVQFNHRVAAYAIAVVALWHASTIVLSAKDAKARLSAVVLSLAVLAQIGLGIWTLLAHVPLSLGLAHQAGAAIVFAACIWHLHRVVRA
jgi:cytochrome c oxidase assembly protein subunit 15